MRETPALGRSFCEAMPLFRLNNARRVGFLVPNRDTSTNVFLPCGPTRTAKPGTSLSMMLLATSRTKLSVNRRFISGPR